MSRYKVAFIGTGGRSVCYGKAYSQCDEVEVVAVVDPVVSHRLKMLEMTGLGDGPQQYDDVQELLDRVDDLDGVVICSPNHLHAEHAVPMLERGLPVALEKPLATSKADCEAICRAEREFGGRTLVGFVLRSTPFYRRARELLAGGAVGRITSCQADELPGTGVSSVMNRSVWRRYTRFSGGAMLEKSCHDMDIMNWLIDSRPVELVSFGDSLIFRGNATLPDTCESCPAGEKCLYYMQPARSSQEDEGEEVLGKFIREDNCCIYNSDKDTVDTQSVMIRYENGAMANFMLNFNCMGPRSGRNLHLIGTRGRIWGNHAEEKVFHHDNASDTTRDYETAGDGTGHGGGDRLHALTLLEMMKNPEFRPAANATMGYLSAMMCLATDVSRRENRFVRFRYRTDGLVDFE